MFSMNSSPRSGAYRLGAIWSTTVWLLLLVIIGWYAGSNQPVEHLDLGIFLGWLFAVPVAALVLRRKYL